MLKKRPGDWRSRRCGSSALPGLLGTLRSVHTQPDRPRRDCVLWEKGVIERTRCTLQLPLPCHRVHNHDSRTPSHPRHSGLLPWTPSVSASGSAGATATAPKLPPRALSACSLPCVRLKAPAPSAPERYQGSTCSCQGPPAHCRPAGGHTTFLRLLDDQRILPSCNLSAPRVSHLPSRLPGSHGSPVLHGLP